MPTARHLPGYRQLSNLLLRLENELAQALEQLCYSAIPVGIVAGFSIWRYKKVKQFH
jgi:hypothetical protein